MKIHTPTQAIVHFDTLDHGAILARVLSDEPWAFDRIIDSYMGEVPTLEPTGCEGDCDCNSDEKRCCDAYTKSMQDNECKVEDAESKNRAAFVWMERARAEKFLGEVQVSHMTDADVSKYLRAVFAVYDEEEGETQTEAQTVWLATCQRRKGVTVGFYVLGIFASEQDAKLAIADEAMVEGSFSFDILKLPVQ